MWEERGRVCICRSVYEREIACVRRTAPDSMPLGEREGITKRYHTKHTIRRQSNPTTTSNKTCPYLSIQLTEASPVPDPPGTFQHDPPIRTAQTGVVSAPRRNHATTHRPSALLEASQKPCSREPNDDVIATGEPDIRGPFFPFLSFQRRTVT